MSPQQLNHSSCELAKSQGKGNELQGNCPSLNQSRARTKTTVNRLTTRRLGTMEFHFKTRNHRPKAPTNHTERGNTLAAVALHSWRTRKRMQTQEYKKKAAAPAIMERLS